jgi:opine dehydrogenase
MKVTIIGGGNMGMCLAGVISRLQDYDVTLCASHPQSFGDTIDVVDDELGITYRSGLFKTTDCIEEAVRDADFIYCTYPAFLRQKFIECAENSVKRGAILGFIPAYGGVEFFCGDLIDKGVIIFGLQKPPYVCRTKERGKVAGLMSKKPKLFEAAIPYAESSRVARFLEDMLQIKTEVLPNYMNVTLLPGNPLLHTSGSYYYLRDYKKGQTFSEQIYYYQSWNDSCSEIICAFSDEMEAVCNKLPIDLSGVKSIQEYYESPTPKALTKKFHSIPSFYPLTLPMIHKAEGYYPDFQSRFFTEDIPFGVCIIKALALIAGIETPTADQILAWYQKMTGKEYFLKDGSFGKDIDETAIPQRFGIDTPEKLRDFYIR